MNTLATTLVFSITDAISQPWHWAFSGAMIAGILVLLNWLGQSFAISTSFKAMCSAMGAGKKTPFFQMDLPSEFWRFAFVAGAIAGGAIAVLFFRSPEAVAISESTIAFLQDLGIAYPEVDQSGQGFIPTDIFNVSSAKGIILAILGGFLVGFGARYGRGCTSGHGITGLAHLQLPSLLTVVGFFIGGLLMAHIFLPVLIGA